MFFFCRGRLAQTEEGPPTNLAIQVQLRWRHFSRAINNLHSKHDSDTFGNFYTHTEDWTQKADFHSPLPKRGSVT